ncbi:MAG TPA: M14 family metallopeptidase [Patescibacteria group bacterium]|nr:M14 family metallopeptidase [Patescibacteria group bacterium]
MIPGGPRPRARRAAPALALALAAGVFGRALAAAPAPDWRTPSERTGSLETPRLAETVAYLKRLASASPWIRVASFGKSGEGRDLVLVIASKDGVFDPAAAAKSGRAVVLVQAGIHAGEIDGKDAGLALLRDIAITHDKAALLDHVVLLFMPIYNVDGHERFGPWNRINQDGPKEMGWRVTSRNLNLNRDYLKADALETRAWLKVFNAWRPDLLVDSHVTDGADFQYDVTYAIETGPNVAPAVAAWVRERLLTPLLPALEARGHQVAPYIQLVDDADPGKGQAGAISDPRFSTGYTVLRNRPSFLIETHMLKDYPTRVRATYDTLAGLLEAVGRDAPGLRAAVRAADADAARPGRTPLRFRVTPATHPVEFKGYAWTREPSAVSGGVKVVYGRDPITRTVDRLDQFEVTVEVERPRAYLVPPQWTEVIDVLRAHGLRLLRLSEPLTTAVGGYRLSEPQWQEAPFEGRHMVTFQSARADGVAREFPRGTVVVPLDQPDSALAVNLLDPQGPDALAAWGFFDAIFEQKEYYEPYVMERMAQEMLDRDPKLRTEFETALADPKFAASPRARLDFFYRRSPYWDNRIGLYPVGLVTSDAVRLVTRPDTP